MAHTYTRVNWASSGAKMSATNLNVMDVGINDGFTDLAAHIASSSEHTGLAKSAVGSYIGDEIAHTQAVGFQPYLVILYGLEEARYRVLVPGYATNLNLVTVLGDAISLNATGISLPGGAGNYFGQHYVWVAWGV